MNLYVCVTSLFWVCFVFFQRAVTKAVSREALGNNSRSLVPIMLYFTAQGEV